MATVSAVIITFNEERNIGRCLESLKGVAEEIIVVDSFSTDKTPAICTSAGVRFIQNEFNGFAFQKNYANSLASGDYILSLDADEALSDALKSDILKFKVNPAADLVEMKRLTNYCGKWIRFSGWYPDRKIRLWKKGKAKWGSQAVHERLIYDSSASLISLNSDILHYSYYTITEHRNKARYYAGIGSADLAAKEVEISLPMVYVKGIAKFLRNYIILLGFLDGYHGLVICYLTAWETYMKYKSLWQANKIKNPV
jgi:glycosyltransferase involved in cell wall biosynthesis